MITKLWSPVSYTFFSLSIHNQYLKTQANQLLDDVFPGLLKLSQIDYTTNNQQFLLQAEKIKFKSTNKIIFSPVHCQSRRLCHVFCIENIENATWLLCCYTFINDDVDDDGVICVKWYLRMCEMIACFGIRMYIYTWFLHCIQAIVWQTNNIVLVGMRYAILVCLVSWKYLHIWLKSLCIYVYYMNQRIHKPENRGLQV